MAPLSVIQTMNRPIKVSMVSKGGVFFSFEKASEIKVTTATNMLIGNELAKPKASWCGSISVIQVHSRTPMKG